MPNGRRIYRHRFWVRMTHWVNVVCMTVLLMSGLQIFNAHPALYWGNISHFDNPVAAIGTFPDWVTLPGSQWLAMGAVGISFLLGCSWEVGRSTRCSR